MRKTNAKKQMEHGPTEVCNHVMNNTGYLFSRKRKKKIHKIRTQVRKS